MKRFVIGRPSWSYVLLATAAALPFITSSLGGLSHRVSCRTESTADFDVLATGNDNVAVSSALVLSRDAPTTELCPGFRVDAQMNPVGPKTLRVLLTSNNTSTRSAHATAALTVNGTTSYVRIGELPSGKTTDKTFVVRVPLGASTVRAHLLLGG